MGSRLKTRSILSYFGSDSEVASQLADLLAGCRHVTIPFCGGLSILPYLTARTLVVNDKHQLVINFYRVLSGRHGLEARVRLLTMCESTLSHPDELSQANKIMSCTFQHGSVEHAWAFWAACWLARKGKGGTVRTGESLSIRRTASGGNNASRLQAAAGDLVHWAQQLRRCEFECRCFRDQLPDVADDQTCGLYLDPPWDGPGKQYLHPFTETDHRDLRDLLDRFEKTAVLIRYGDTPLIRELYDGWSIQGAESRTQHNSYKDEIWIMKNLDRSK